jgi:hypothetical protein
MQLHTVLTVLPVTGLTVGRIKMILTNKVQRQAHALTNLLALPICHGPGVNLPKTALQLDPISLVLGRHGNLLTR